MDFITVENLLKSATAIDRYLMNGIFIFNAWIVTKEIDARFLGLYFIQSKMGRIKCRKMKAKTHLMGEFFQIFLEIREVAFVLLIEVNSPIIIIGILITRSPNTITKKFQINIS